MNWLQRLFHFHEWKAYRKGQRCRCGAYRVLKPCRCYDEGNIYFGSGSWMRWEIVKEGK